MSAMRAVRDFHVTKNPWPHVDRWAADQRYQMIQHDDGHRVYKKGGFLVGARTVEVTADGHQVHVEAYAAGPMGALPRSVSRAEVNALLREFGQQPIQ